ncbi:hypothetical protein BO71DRAFT_6307 [Aspergillus ellipticus CBS 707.79]|uniref:Uncharacterized protein n=1 Tax=Aspergillus ellipticus CBS 707.79 TaxID=1448320 RepID=A0A319DPG2_9EURO|nr:hypothetical protein BO71DRAFT_6307 [Aspergillus ellipticus CBS 707.79]
MVMVRLGLDRCSGFIFSLHLMYYPLLSLGWVGKSGFFLVYYVWHVLLHLFILWVVLYYIILFLVITLFLSAVYLVSIYLSCYKYSE